MKKRGFTLVEIIVAIGLFALIMTLAAGAYLVMININKQSQGIATGINNLSFAIDTMTRTIRTGFDYGCPSAGNDCSGGDIFSVKNSNGVTITYSLSSNSIIQQKGATSVAITDSSVTINSLKFYASGTAKPPNSEQARVTIVVSGTVSYGHDKFEQFTIQTGATMRGSDI